MKPVATFSFLVLSIFLIVKAYAQPCGTYLNPQYSVLSIPDVEYGRVTVPRFNSSVLVYDSVILGMDIYLPQGDNNDSRPLIVLMHGGGLSEGTRKSYEIRAICDSFARRGYVTASVSYRLGYYRDIIFTGYPFAHDPSEVIRSLYRATQDVKGAIRFLKGNADVYGIDTSNVFVGGASAGGFVALNVAYMTGAHEKPAAAGTIGRIYNTFLWSVLRNIARPDLGPVEGYLNLNGTSPSVKGVINIYGAISNTNLIEDKYEAALFQYYVNNDLIVACGYGKFFHHLGLGNVPYVHGPCSIRNRANQLGFATMRHKTIIENTSNLHDVMPRIGFFTAQLSPWLDSLICVPNAGLCAIPENPFATNVQYNSATVTWNPVPNATQYRVTGNALGLPERSFLVNQNYFHVGRLAAGTPHVWKVQAICPFDESLPSPVDTFTTLSPLRLADSNSEAATPDGIAVPNPAQNEVSLIWNHPDKTEHSAILFDLSGRKAKVFDSSVQGFYLTRDNLPPGLYFWIITDKNNLQLSSGKVVLQ